MCAQGWWLNAQQLHSNGYTGKKEKNRKSFMKIKAYEIIILESDILRHCS